MKKRMGKRSVIAGVVVATAAAIAGPLAVSSGGAGSAAPGGYMQGIRVHGDWTIEVRSPGGRLLRRARFANSLTNVGAQRLALFLTGDQTPGLWAVELGGPQPGGKEACLNDVKGPAECLIVEPAWGPKDNRAFKNLTVKEEGSSVVLAGKATAQRAGTLTDVATAVSSCPGSVAPAKCLAPPYRFTAAAIEAIPVQPNQQISVTVKISFK